MICTISKVLSGASLEATVAAARGLSFGDGARMAGRFARGVKSNLQADGADPAFAAALDRVRATVIEALLKHDVFRAFALPRRISHPLISLYQPGHEYGWHVDDALMGEGEGRLRTDLSVTLFLAPPESYAGGELEIDTVAGIESVKLPAGDAALYPSGATHRVTPVTEGHRLAAVAWVQSQVRDPGARDVLFDLDRARRLAHARDPQGEEFRLLAKTYSSLMRRWAEG